MSAMRAAAAATALLAGIVGVWRGTWAVGGSDSSCYALMAQSFARGELQPSSTLARHAPWENAAATFAPGGFIPSPVRADAASPVCAPGFSLLLAPFYWAGGADAIFLLTPIAGVVLIYLTFRLGVQLCDEAAGLAAALLVAAAPVFVFQLVQPMNDVSVAALWTGIVLLAAQRPQRSTIIGALTGLAVLIRPNLAPAAVVVGAWCLGDGWRSSARFVLAASPFLFASLALNDALYGNPLGSGYEPAAALFAARHVLPNLSNYVNALWETQLAFPLLGFAALALPFQAARGARRLGLTAGVIVCVYLLYRPFPEWWYLRFLLPALPMLTVLATAALVAITRRRWVLVPITALVATASLTSFAMREALDLTAQERRFRAAGSVARERLSPNAVYVTVWESGSVRFHADAEAVLWDSLEPQSLDAALAWLVANGREPYLMLEEWEETPFRARFSAHTEIGQLDWPPRFDINRRVRIYDPADRSRFVEGGSVPTEFLFDAGR